MNIQLDPLTNISYFISWGGDAALELALGAFEGFLEKDMSGKRVLEIGAGGGKMSCFFGLLGAAVTGIDIEPDFPRMALAEAAKWGVGDRMDFRKGSEALADLPDASFDLVFTKSVLLYFDDLEYFMQKLSPKLKPGGQICFLENRCRNFVDRMIRNIVHLKRGQRNYHYMNSERIAEIGRIFIIDKVQMIMNPVFDSYTPGWYLICGHQR